MRGLWRRLFTFEDELRPNAAAAVAALRGGTWRGRHSSSDRMRVLMLTGACGETLSLKSGEASGVIAWILKKNGGVCRMSKLQGRHQLGATHMSLEQWQNTLHSLGWRSPLHGTGCCNFKAAVCTRAP